MKTVITVRGPNASEALGFTSKHELLHIAGQMEQGKPVWFCQLGLCNVATV